MTIGLDVLIAWAMFATFVGVLAAFVLRGSSDDALAEARRARPEASESHDKP
jgi:hypothetical protein